MNRTVCKVKGNVRRNFISKAGQSLLEDLEGIVTENVQQSINFSRLFNISDYTWIFVSTRNNIVLFLNEQIFKTLY